MASLLAAETEQAYRRLAAWVAERARRKPCPVFGINGAQGSGKSTLAAFLREELQAAHGLRAAVLSLDDFYLPRGARLALAQAVQPLFATRGVPGTHEVALGIATLDTLRRLTADASLALPRFAKADDDRLPMCDWPRVHGPFDLILFEGWCIATPAQDEAELVTAINALEAEEDADGRWRRQVNAALRGPYADWFARIDWLIFLQVPDFASVRRWRGQQERETTALAGAAGRQIQSAAQLERFIQHYERLTRQALRALPARADVHLELDAGHRVRWLAAQDRSSPRS